MSYNQDRNQSPPPSSSTPRRKPAQGRGSVNRAPSSLFSDQRQLPGIPTTDAHKLRVAHNLPPFSKRTPTSPFDETTHAQERENVQKLKDKFCEKCRNLVNHSEPRMPDTARTLGMRGCPGCTVKCDNCDGQRRQTAGRNSPAPKCQRCNGKGYRVVKQSCDKDCTGHEILNRQMIRGPPCTSLIHPVNQQFA